MKVNCRSRRDGGAVVEFALVSSLTFILIFLQITLGLAVWSYNNIAEAVREGARYASVRGSTTTGTKAGPTSDDANVKTQVLNYCFVMDTTQLTIHSTWLQGNNNPGSQVQVTANYNFSWWFGFPNMATLPLYTQTTMTIVH
jgi:Flp pilus assembly protein TadG